MIKLINENAKAKEIVQQGYVYKADKPKQEG